MTRDLAKLVALRVFRSSSEIGGMCYVIKEHCTEEERKEFNIGIATAIAAIHDNVLHKLYALYPDLEKEFDEKIDKYGSAF